MSAYNINRSLLDIESAKTKIHFAFQQVLIGSSSPLIRLKLALTEFGLNKQDHLLFHGPTGSGKREIAKVILKQIKPQSTLLSIECSGLSEQSFKEHLFGKTKELTKSLEQQGMADYATIIYLSSFDKLSLTCQQEFLNSIQDSRFYKYGISYKPQPKVRFIISIEQDPYKLSSEGKLSSNLIKHFTILPKFPSLMEVNEDIPSIVNDYLNEIFGIIHVTPSAMEIITQQEWPANLTQLRKYLEQLKCYMREGMSIDETVVRFALGLETIEKKEYKKSSEELQALFFLMAMKIAIEQLKKEKKVVGIKTLAPLLQINGKKGFSTKQLSKLFKKYKEYFPSLVKSTELIKHESTLLEYRPLRLLLMSGQNGTSKFT